jgi:GTP-binding protein YchF
MRIGIIGLPASGKTTLFRIVTQGAAASPSSAGSFQVTTATVPVPDPRVEVLAEMYQPRKTTYARVELADVAGIAGDGDTTRDANLSGELANVLGRYDAFLHVVRAFDDGRGTHPLGPLDPARDVRRLDSDLLLSDLSKVTNRLERLAESLRRGKILPSHETDRLEQALLSRLQPHLESGLPVRDLALADTDEKLLRGFQLLTAKPVLVVLNLGDTGPAPALDYPHRASAVTSVRGRLEADLVDLDDDERAMFMSEFGLESLSHERLIHEAYRLLERINFFTVGDDEVRAWEVAANATTLDCAAAIHTDLAKGFIRAEVTGYDDLIAAGTMVAAKAKGKVRLEGRDKTVADGDIIVVRFNV